MPPPRHPATLPATTSNNPVGLLCNLTGGGAFSEDCERPHLPVLVAFGGDPLHVCRIYGSLELHRAVSENSGALVRSVQKLDPKEQLKVWDDLTFQFGPRTFLYADANRAVGFASTPDEAERRVKWFADKYAKPPKPEGGCFHLIRTDGVDISLATVPLAPDTILSDSTLALHYGGESLRWHLAFIRKLAQTNHGLSIFEGAPGTGKTYYLRHLMGVLAESHRFFFIPASSMGVLSQSDFVGFWETQRHLYPKQKFVVILEDSDAALMTRGSDNRDQVSAILNLSDGMLADFLRLQIICTINCAASDIDQALLRPGRLICHRVFGRLDCVESCRLAESLGKRLTVVRDYSLAEIFAGDAAEEINRSRQCSPFFFISTQCGGGTGATRFQEFDVS